jgi:hypothetical protein
VACRRQRVAVFNEEYRQPADAIAPAERTAKQMRNPAHSRENLGAGRTIAISMVADRVVFC